MPILDNRPARACKLPDGTMGVQYGINLGKQPIQYGICEESNQYTLPGQQKPPPPIAQNTQGFQMPEISSFYIAAGVAGSAVGAYHGYKRNDSVMWAIVWSMMGGLFPIIVLPLALAQGIGKRKVK